MRDNEARARRCVVGVDGGIVFVCECVQFMYAKGSRRIETERETREGMHACMS